MMRLLALAAAGCAVGAVSLHAVSEIDEWASLVIAVLRYAICELLARCPPAPLPGVGA